MLKFGVNSNLFTNFGPERLKFCNEASISYKGKEKLGKFSFFPRSEAKLVITDRSLLVCGENTKIHCAGDFDGRFFSINHLAENPSVKINYFFDLIDGCDQMFIKADGSKEVIQGDVCFIIGFLSAHCFANRSAENLRKTIEFPLFKQTQEKILKRIDVGLKYLNNNLPDSTTINQDNTNLNIRISSAKLSNYIYNILYRENEKRIPKFILRNTIKNKKQFLRAFLELEDPYRANIKNDKDYLFFMSQSINFAADVFFLLTSIGINAKLKFIDDSLCVFLAANTVLKSIDYLYDLSQIASPKNKYRPDSFVSIQDIAIDLYGIELKENFYINGFLVN